MAGAALGVWLVTAMGGAYLWSFTTGIGRPESNARSSSLPSWLLFTHPALALSGLGVWIAYLVSDEDVLPWVAFAILLLTALAGDLLLMRTMRKDSPRAVAPAVHDPALPPAEDAAANERRAEDQMPRPVIIGHGVLAVTTIVLVFLVAIGVG